MQPGDDPSARTELWLARHAQSEGNAAGVFQGSGEYPLSALGRDQAALLARRLVGERFAAIYCSDLERARDTAQAVADAAGGQPITDPRLREIDTGRWSGLTAEAIAARFPEEWTRWLATRDPAHRRGGGESYLDVQARMIVTLDEIAGRHPGQRVLIVAHGGCLAAWLAHLLELPLAALWRCPLANTSLTRVLPFMPPPPGMATRPGSLISYNDTIHLDLPIPSEDAA